MNRPSIEEVRNIACNFKHSPAWLEEHIDTIYSIIIGAAKEGKYEISVWNTDDRVLDYFTQRGFMIMASDIGPIIAWRINNKY